MELQKHALQQVEKLLEYYMQNTWQTFSNLEDAISKINVSQDDKLKILEAYKKSNAISYDKINDAQNWVKAVLSSL
jgi:hypothetical protein